MKYNEPKHAGVICLHVFPSGVNKIRNGAIIIFHILGTTEFSWAHSTDNMLIAYNSGHQAKVYYSNTV